MDGSNRSGDDVARMMASSSGAVTPAFAIAFRAASALSDATVSPGDAMWRSLMPVRSMIHSSLVSIPMAAKS